MIFLRSKILTAPKFEPLGRKCAATYFDSRNPSITIPDAWTSSPLLYFTLGALIEDPVSNKLENEFALQRTGLRWRRTIPLSGCSIFLFFFFFFVFSSRVTFVEPWINIVSMPRARFTAIRGIKQVPSHAISIRSVAIDTVIPYRGRKIKPRLRRKWYHRWGETWTVSSDLFLRGTSPNWQFSALMKLGTLETSNYVYIYFLFSYPLIFVFEEWRFANFWGIKDKNL